MSGTLRDLFHEHHALTKSEMDTIWAECVFAFDANALLNVYRYEDITRDDFFRVVEHLRGRVFVPWQAADEFYRNRLKLIQDQADKYRALSKSISGALAALEDGTFVRSGFLNIPQLRRILDPSVKEALNLIAAQQGAHPKLLRDDPYLERLVDVVGDQVGIAPTPEERAAQTKLAKERLECKVPPGYEDAKKSAPHRYGDVFIWFELLRHAERTKRPVIFVSDDDKEDWWHIVSGEKRGPRPELRREMRERAGVEFLILNPARLLSEISGDLKVSISNASIENAQRITQELQLRHLTQLWIQRDLTDERFVHARNNAFAWARKLLSDSDLVFESPDTIKLRAREGHLTTVKCVVPDARTTDEIGRILMSEEQGANLVLGDDTSRYLLIVVAPAPFVARRYQRYLNKHPISFERNHISIGLDTPAGFAHVASFEGPVGQMPF